MSRLIATVGGLGYLGPAPGTWASAAAVLVAWPVHALGGFPALFIATIAAFCVGWWATERATRHLGEHDPSEIVIDEIAGQWVALWPLSAGLWWAGADGWTFPWPGWVGAFVLFRLLDIWKPGPVGWADRRGDSLGTMLDDAIAGGLAGVALAVLGALAHLVLIA